MHSAFSVINLLTNTPMGYTIITVRYLQGYLKRALNNISYFEIMRLILWRIISVNIVQNTSTAPKRIQVACKPT